MRKTACTRMVDFHLVDGAGHWVQQEQPGKVTELLTKFLQDQSARDGINGRPAGSKITRSDRDYRTRYLLA